MQTMESGLKQNTRIMSDGSLFRWITGTTMPGSVRLDIYRTQNGTHRLTPNQRRRYTHKVNRWIRKRDVQIRN